jgi:hypothetical protein
MAFVEHACTVVSHEYRDEPGGGISMLVILIVSGPDFVFPLYAVKNGTIHDVNKAKFLQPEGSKVPCFYNRCILVDTLGCTRAQKSASIIRMQLPIVNPEIMDFVVRIYQIGAVFVVLSVLAFALVRK